MKYVQGIVLALICSLSMGCTQFGDVRLSNVSEVELSQANYKVVATGLRGESSCVYLFGVIPLGWPQNRVDALDNLVEAANLQDESRALINVAQGSRSAFYFFVAFRSVHVRADVIEFDG